MKIDPTAQNRQAIVDAVKKILPSSSPLSQSIKASKEEEKAAQLESEAAAQRLKAEEIKAQEELSMINKGDPAKITPAENTPIVNNEATDREPASQIVQPTQESASSRGLMMEAAAEEKLGKENASALEKTQIAIEAEQNRAAEQRRLQQEKINQKLTEIENTKIEPKSFWEGKTTGQKISAGIGLFLSSLTPQGAQNAVNIIQKEVDRDLELQKLGLNKNQNTLSILEKQLGSIDAAEAAYRLKALQNVELKLKQTSENAKGSLVKAKAQQGLEKIQAESAAARQKFQLELMKLNKEASKDRKLGAEEQKRLDSSRDALKGVLGMRSALAKGQNTFSLVGDNDFTMAQRVFAENLGRLQSGGAISKQEEERFMAMAPTVTDSKSMQLKKLAQLEQMMKERIAGLGKDPGQQISGMSGINFKAK